MKTSDYVQKYIRRSRNHRLWLINTSMSHIYEHTKQHVATNFESRLNHHTNEVLFDFSISLKIFQFSTISAIRKMKKMIVLQIKSLENKGLFNASLFVIN